MKQNALVNVVLILAAIALGIWIVTALPQLASPRTAELVGGLLACLTAWCIGMIGLALFRK